MKKTTLTQPQMQDWIKETTAAIDRIEQEQSAHDMLLDTLPDDWIKVQPLPSEKEKLAGEKYWIHQALDLDIHLSKATYGWDKTLNRLDGTCTRHWQVVDNFSPHRIHLNTENFDEVKAYLNLFHETQKVTNIEWDYLSPYQVQVAAANMQSMEVEYLPVRVAAKVLKSPEKSAEFLIGFDEYLALHLVPMFFVQAFD